MKKFLIATGVAVLAFASIAGAQSLNNTFNVNLTVGSTGDGVSALQTWLISNGYNIPAITSGAAAKGYFGSQTKEAVAAYQKKVGLPSFGFFGPMTRELVNAGNTGGGGSMSTPTCPAGFTCTSNTVAVNCPVGFTCTPVGGGTTVGGTVTGITTPGVEGTLAAQQTNSGLVSTAYEGDSMIGILGVKLDAKNSDISVQRVKLDLGTDTKIYNKIYSKVYVTDGTNILASADLNSSTIVKDSGRYYITIAGFSLVIPKNSSKNLVIKVDVRPTVDSADLAAYTVRFASQGVRGVDGAGIDQYAADTTISRATTVSASLSDSATLKLSTNTSTIKSADVVAAGGSAENEYDRLTVLTFDLKAEKDDIKVTDLSINVTKSGTGSATASTSVYLYDGTTELDSSPVTNGVATFPDIDYVISRDTTKTFTVKVDIRNANGTVSQIAANIGASDVTAENSQGDGITESGSAIGETMFVRNIGPTFVLNSKSSTRTSVSSNDTSGIASSTGTGKFSITITAVGGDISFGSRASTTPAFGTTSATLATIYKNGSANGTPSANTAGGTNAIVSYSTPSSGVTTSGETWTLSEGNSVTLDVDYQITVAGSSANNYAFQLNGINWYTSTNGQQTSTSMTDKSDWRTSTISLP